MSSNKQNPIVPGTVRALTNKWQAGGQSNLQQANLSLLDALPDRNCSLAAQPAPGPALAVAINRWENRTAPTPAQRALQLFNSLPDGELSLIPQSSQSNAVVRARPRLTSFAFSSLPPEVRLMIWELLIPAPQTIRITDNAMRHNRSHSRQNPAILHINSESRTEALKHLKRLFGGVNGNGYPVQFKYFNPILDLLYFDGGGTQLFAFPPTILPPVADLTHEAPMAQSDNVVSLQVGEWQMNQAGPAAYFRNVECLRIQYFASRSPGNWFTPAYPTNTAGRQLFVREIHLHMFWDTDTTRRWYNTRLNAGLVNEFLESRFCLRGSISVWLTRLVNTLLTTSATIPFESFQALPSSHPTTQPVPSFFTCVVL
ncbi:uncharacterized protein EAE97_010577 [Botrytis byssoidea]|uniref:2EXR domain-containing protein n=1 Tax=Botrytis byssoidea TaxID=139641 RepID=A0A9P5HVM0_9HELO|nr:uncharacterized protein EAE97_010577 [Botrytis byssoidea]KAF7924626.1 hypothetical protein EAE97_010577 [Botrytis byssoidea]